jgi:molybdopterin-guanine dinucleotide biosynthesis protein B
MAIPHRMDYDPGMIPIVSIVGKSGSGKTTLIEKLIAELTRRGWRVATLKHSHHDFRIDQEGKDSWRHRQAGAVTTVLASPFTVAVIEKPPRDYTLAEAAGRYIREADIILAEGYKGNPHPKIEVCRTELRPERLCGPGEEVIALAGDRAFPAEAPFYDWNDAPGLADLIERRFLRKRA